MPPEPLALRGLAKAVGAAVPVPAAERYADMGHVAVDPDLAKFARARAKKMREAFEEGARLGSGGWSPPGLWRRSDTLRRLACGKSEGFDVVGICSTCSDSRAVGRSYWRVCGAWKGVAWVRSIDVDLEPVDLIVPLSTLRRLIDLKPLAIGDMTIGGL